MTLAFAGVLFGVSGCAEFGAPACSVGQHAADVAELLFGRNIGTSLGVSDADWTDFLKNEISPRFPDGLTVIDAAGEWRDTASGTTVGEPSKVVMIVLSGQAQERSRLDTVIQVYKSRFHQQSVGLLVHAACVSF